MPLIAIVASTILIVCYAITVSASVCPSLSDLPEITFKPTYRTGDGIEEIGDFTMTCRAAYPIEWSFDGPMPTQFTVKRKTEFKKSEDFRTLAPICYKSIVTAVKERGSGPTGNYSCSSLSHPNKTSSIYRFYYDGGFSTLFDALYETVIPLARKSTDNEFVIPCPSNYEKINASLVKIDQLSEVALEPEQGKLRYDPKIGFLLNATIYPDPVGRYTCLGNFPENSEYKKHFVAEVVLEIQMTDDTSSFSPKQTYISLTNIANVSLYCESIHEIEFVKTISPTTKILRDNIKYRLSRVLRNFATIVVQGVGENDDVRGDITCQTKDSNRTVIHTWSFDNAQSCKCLWKKQILVKDRGIFVCSTGRQFMAIPDHTFHSMCKNPSECRMSRYCPQERNCIMANSHYIGHVGPFTNSLTFGIIKCSVQEYGKGNVAELSNYEELFKQYDYDKPDMTLSSRRDVLHVGDFEKFNCRVATYSLLPDVHWALKMKNGDLLYLNDTQVTRPSDNYQLNFSNEWETIIHFTDKNIESVYCFASSWETGEFFNVSVKVLISDINKPTEDPEKSGCSNVNKLPSLVLRRAYPEGLGLVPAPYQWQDVTGLDVILDVNEYAIVLYCLANYLTDWTHNGAPVLYNSKKKVISVQSRKSSLCYEDALTLSVFPSEIGNYSCRKPHDVGTSSSMYLFVKGDEHNLIDYGRHEKVQVNKSSEWTILPCLATDPTVTVELSRQNVQGNIEVLNVGESVSYNPKVGFSLRTSLLLLLEAEQDVYICSCLMDGEGEKTNEKDHVFFTLDFNSNAPPDLSDSELCRKEQEQEIGMNSGAVVVPWVLVALLALINVAAFIVVRHTFERSTVGSTVLFKANNGGLQPSTESSVPTIVNVQDTGISNAAYEKFH